MSDDLADRLRAWATGWYGIEAGTELLLRYRGGRFARPGRPWIHHAAPRPWIDFAVLAEGGGALSGDERAVLLIAVSLADGRPLDLADAVCRPDRRSPALVLAALAHAAGSHEHPEVLPERTATGEEIVLPRGPRIPPGPLYPWPDDGVDLAWACRGVGAKPAVAEVVFGELVVDEAPAICRGGPRAPAATAR